MRVCNREGGNNRRTSFESEERIITLYTEEKLNCREIASLPWVTIEADSVQKLLRRRGVVTRQGKPPRQYSHNDHYFDSLDTEEQAYWLGFIAADGCVRPRPKRLVLTLASVDHDHVERFRNALGSNHPIGWYRYGGYTRSQLTIHSPILVDALGSLNIIPNKTATFRWPKMRDDLKRHFLRGYFDGDGCFCVTDNSLSLSVTSNLDFLTDVQEYLEEALGFRHRVLTRRHTDGVGYNLSVGGAKQVRTLAAHLYDGATVFLPRKADKRFLLN